jgi:4-amino-4-deoxy-L-arabinose transferase-like glycosyltransferase
LWHNQGFGTDWSSAEWREPYLDFPVYKDLLARNSTFHLTAYRPPAIPYLLAFVYAFVGRSFAAWRILNCAIMAGAVTIAAVIAARFGGRLAAVMTAGLGVLNPNFIASSQRFLTEALATFLVSLLVWAWLKNREPGSSLTGAARVGFVLALLIAARTIFVFWIPIAFLVPAYKDVSGRKRTWLPKAVCLVTCLLVIGPWFVRNIVVTKAFMPLGTEGAINLPTAFGPRALASAGVWVADMGDGMPELLAQNLDPLTFEVRLAKIRSALTFDWMSQHALAVMKLMVLHIWQELRPNKHIAADVLLVMGVLAAVFFRKSPDIRAMSLFFCLNILSVSLTWSVQGRFMIPVQPLLISLTGAIVAEFARKRIILDKPMKIA